MSPAPVRRTPWRELFQRGIEAYYAGDLDAGRAACEELLSRDGIPEDVRRQARRNQIFYARRLYELVPSATLQSIACRVPAGWSRFNPSIAADADGYRAIVRSSNYTVDKMRYTVQDGGQVIRTRNYLALLDGERMLRTAEPIDDCTDPASRSAFPVRGFEDCRLFQFRGSWYATATARDYNPRGICQVVLLRLCDGAFADPRFLSDAAAGVHEKNWMPLPRPDALLFIYSCRPTAVLRFNDSSNEVEEVARGPGPRIAADFRGGSQAIGTGDGYLFVVHEAVDFEDGGRVYPHRFVLMDDSFTITRVSPQFFFLERGVEFCAGLALRGEWLTASFGSRDREACLATMRLGEVLAILSPVAA